jgi:hypothetical protein
MMPKNPWSPEDWAWEQIRSGKIADFNAHFGTALDPSNQQGWGNNRKLSAGFLRRIFAEQASRNEIPDEGARVIGAFLPDGQVLSFARLHRPVWLDQCRFEKPIDFELLEVVGTLSLEASWVNGGVMLRHAKIDDQLNMSRATFAQTVNCDGLQVGRHLLMREKATFKGDVILIAAKIDGQLDMRGSTFEQTVNGNGLHVGRNLFMREAATFKGDVILIGARIDGQLDMRGSTFEQKVDGDGLQIGRHLLMREKTTFRGDVTLDNAYIQGQLDMSDSTFEQKVDGSSLQVSQHLFMQNSTFRQPTSLIFARVGADLDLRGACFASLDLTGAKVTQELRLADMGSTVLWQAWVGGGSSFKLRNAQVGTLQDALKCWPCAIDLEGFTYGHLGGFGATATDDARDRSISDWKAWLAKDGGLSHRYSPRPYAQLASVLVAAGRRDYANSILFAARERERAEARRSHRWPRWLWLSALSYLFGYGIGIYTFRVLFWILGSVAAGTAVLWFLAPAANAKGVFWCAGASLDRLLPIIQLNKEFADFFNDPGRQRLTGGVIAFFAALGLWGWVLGSFLIAAVSGLTQRS